MYTVIVFKDVTRKEILLKKTERKLIDCFKHALKELKRTDHSRSTRVFTIINHETGEREADTLLTFRCFYYEIKRKRIDNYLRMSSACEDQNIRAKYLNQASKISHNGM